VVRRSPNAVLAHQVHRTGHPSPSSFAKLFGQLTNRVVHHQADHRIDVPQTTRRGVTRPG
jgi:hypothetical protein